MSEEQIAAARVFLRTYRRLTLWLATYTLGTLIGGTLMTFSGSDWTVEFGKVFVASSLIAAVMLVLICWGLANAHCPIRRGAYYAPAKVTHRLLHATLPFRRKPCRQCGWDAFRV